MKRAVAVCGLCLAGYGQASGAVHWFMLGAVCAVFCGYLAYVGAE